VLKGWLSIRHPSGCGFAACRKAVGPFSGAEDLRDYVVRQEWMDLDRSVAASAGYRV